MSEPHAKSEGAAKADLAADSLTRAAKAERALQRQQRDARQTEQQKSRGRAVRLVTTWMATITGVAIYATSKSLLLAGSAALAVVLFILTCAQLDTWLKKRLRP